MPKIAHKSPVRNPRPSQAEPPWASDERPELWVTAATAARIWFRKSVRRIRQSIVAGEFKGIFPVYYDGYTWWLRLPRLPKSSEKSTHIG